MNRMAGWSVILVLVDGAGNLNGIGNTLANLLADNDGSNHLDGLSGSDTLEGGADDSALEGAGSDTLDGGARNDTYPAGAGDTLTEFASAGTDTDDGFINATDNDSQDTIIANDAGNLLAWAGGNASLEGGSSIDIAHFSATVGGYTVAQNAPGLLTLEGLGGIDVVPGVELYSFGGAAAVSQARPLALQAPAAVPDYVLEALQSGARWAQTPGQTLQLSYSFMTAAPSYGTTLERSSFASMTGAQMDAVRDALEAYERFLDVEFIEVADADAGVDLRFGRNSQSSDAYAYLPGESGFPAQPGANQEEGDVWISTTLDEGESGLEPGQELYAALLHEIGHALGLRHPHESPSLAGLGHADEDTDRYTLMSYNYRSDSVVVELTGGDVMTADAVTYNWRPETPMLYDIAALQELYGANDSATAGDDVHVFPEDRPFFATLWDAGGHDRIDASAYSSENVIDLREGAFSSLGVGGMSINAVWNDWFLIATYMGPWQTYGSNNLAIAWGTVIEDATGGSGYDVLIGNAADNALSGGGGADTLTGGAGNDRFVFATAPNAATNRDAITDFVSGADRIVLDNDAFTGLAIGALPGTAFLSGAGLTAAQNATQRFVYDTTTGDLYYDAGGNTGATAVKVATLGGAPSLTATDFEVVV